MCAAVKFASTAVRKIESCLLCVLFLTQKKLAFFATHRTGKFWCGANIYIEKEVVSFTTMKLPYSVYVLISLKDQKFYVGYSANVDQRLKDHANGNVVSTKDRRPLELIYIEYHNNKYDALRRERYFKTSKGRKALRLIIRESLEEFFVREANP